MISELYKIRYILFIELATIILFAVYGYMPSLVLLSLVLLVIILYAAFNTPILILHVLIFSMLIDAVIPVKHNTTGPSLLLAEFFLIMFIGIGVIKFLLNFEKRSDVPSIILVWIPFLIWSMIIGLLVGIEKLETLTYWKNYFAGFFALSVALYSIKNKSHVKSLIIGLIIWGLLLSLIEIRILFSLGGFTVSIVGLFINKNLLTIGWGRSNYLAAFFVIIIPLTIGYLTYVKSKSIKIFLTATLIIMSFAMILTLSRGGILSLLIALVVLFSRILKARTFIPFIAVLILIAVVILLNPLTYVLINRISSIETSGSYFTRLNFYRDVWNAFLNHPITGVGMGNLGLYSTFVLAKGASPSAHDLILGMLGETGIIGAILYFSILGVLIKDLFHKFKTETNESLKIFRWCFISAIIGAFLHSLMEPTLDGLQFSIIFWTLVGVYYKLSLLKTSDEQ